MDGSLYQRNHCDQAETSMESLLCYWIPILDSLRLLGSKYNGCSDLPCGPVPVKKDVAGSTSIVHDNSNGLLLDGLPVGLVFIEIFAENATLCIQEVRQ